MLESTYYVFRFDKQMFVPLYLMVAFAWSVDDLGVPFKITRFDLNER
jgi:hypothetical protein